MGSAELIRFEAPPALAQAAAEDWLQQAQAASDAGRLHTVALSGGRIAKQLFQAIAAGAKASSTPLRGVHFFWADERCVPPDDPESNYAVAREQLFEPLRIPANQVHRIRGEISPKEAAGKAAAELRRVAATAPPGPVVLDLVFLGMGEDGHVASLFPNMPREQIASTEVYQAVVGPKPPPQRISLTYASIAGAREVWVLASGPGKTEALRASLAPGSQTPLGRVLASRARTKILSDIGLPTWL